MAQYNLEKNGRSSRRVEIKKGGFKFHFGAMLVSFLIAFIMWLYIDGQEHRQRMPEAESGTGENTVVAEILPSDWDEAATV